MKSLLYGLSTSLGGFCLGGLFYVSSLSSTAGRESPENAKNHGQPRPLLVTQTLMDDYKRDGVMVIDNVLTDKELKAARDEVNTMMTKKQFILNENDDTNVRTDIVFSISETFCRHQKAVIGPDLLLALRCARAIPHELLALGINSATFGVPFVNQLACYGRTGFYIPHRDAPELFNDLHRHPLQWLLQPGMNERQVTIILYLNDLEWDSMAGGAIDSGHLKCYLHTDCTDMTGVSASSVLSIKPVGGRMVVFDSKRVLHEVCPSHSKHRLAITVWVGGNHSRHLWLRPFCLPIDEINWR
jgi:hypothetical protein